MCYKIKWIWITYTSFFLNDRVDRRVINLLLSCLCHIVRRGDEWHTWFFRLSSSGFGLDRDRKSPKSPTGVVYDPLTYVPLRSRQKSSSVGRPVSIQHGTIPPCVPLEVRHPPTPVIPRESVTVPPLCTSVLPPCDPRSCLPPKPLVDVTYPVPDRPSWRPYVTFDTVT